MINGIINKKVIISAAVFAIILIPFFIKVPVKTQKGIFGEYEEKIDFKGLYFAEEHVIFQGDISHLKIRYKNGDKIPKGTMISEGLYADEAGVLLMHLDGYENDYNRNNIKDIKLKELEKISSLRENLPGIKIINNSQWYISALVAGNHNFKKNTYKDVNIGNVTYMAQIIDVIDSSEGKNIVLRINSDLDVVNLQRAFNGYIVKSKFNGIIIPSEALIKIGNETGVFVKQNGYAKFKRANVLFQGEEKAVISSENNKNSINENDEVIINPKRIKDGTKVK